MNPNSDMTHPPVTEIFFDCALFGRTVIRFDGAVLEVFSLNQRGTGDRYHRTMFSLHLTAPDRKGLCKLDMVLDGIPGGFYRLVPSAQAHLIDPLLASLHDAGVHVTRGW